MEFDAAKDRKNIEKHGVSLAFGAAVFEDGAHVIVPTIREADEEERSKGVGLVDGKLYTVVFVWRGEARRLISVRRSNTREEREYHRHPR